MTSSGYGVLYLALDDHLRQYQEAQRVGKAIKQRVPQFRKARSVGLKAAATHGQAGEANTGLMLSQSLDLQPVANRRRSEQRSLVPHSFSLVADPTTG